jgi:hypothetical protein
MGAMIDLCINIGKGIDETGYAIRTGKLHAPAKSGVFGE